MLPVLHRTLELRPPQIRVGPANICIYCRDGTIPVDELTDEHIIPDGRGGNLILERASCSACARSTNEVERKIINNCFGMLRDVFRLGSRKRRGSAYKNRLREFRMGTGLTNDADMLAALDTELPRYPSGSDMPYIIPFEVFPRAPALSGELQRADLSPKLHISHPDDMDDRIAKITPDDGTVFKITTEIGHFERFIAKIAHAFAVSKLGPDGFHPFLGNMIRGEADWDLGYYVGCTEKWPSLDSVHVLLLMEKTALIRSRISPTLIEERPVYVVRIKLFDFAQGPLYEVVVGLRPSAASTNPRLLKIQPTLCL